MRRRARALSRVLEWCALLLLFAGTATAQTPNRAKVTATADGPVLTFTDADYRRNDRPQMPRSGWERGPIGRAYSFEAMGKSRATKVLWIRLRFDAGQLGPGPQALYAENNHERLVVHANGRELYRTFIEGDTRALGWYRPELARLPVDALRPGLNTVTIRVESNYDLVSGNFRVGAAAPLQRLYDQRGFWRISVVQAANFSMLVAAFGALMFWLLRRHEIELLMMALLGIAWFVRDYNFVATRAPFDVVAFKLMTYYAVYPAMSASLAFCLIFVRVRHWQRHALVLGAAGLLLCLSRLLTVDTAIIADFGSDTLGNVLTLACAAYTVALLVLHRRRTNQAAALWLVLALLVVFAGTIHDIGRLWDVRAWDGLGLYLQPYLGSAFCLIMMLSFGVRAYRAFGAMESINAVLETRVTQARAELQVSEDRRRELEVARALEGERERIMREMHDGIGSNLVSALAVAERQAHPRETIAVLRRALSDLKLTVDSLEPFDGDLVALLGNFRHRAETDLRAAGVRSVWKVGSCQPLPWLDATNALHVLRIFQEALANALTHSGATEIVITCDEMVRDGREGVLAALRDNGCGLPAEAIDAPSGHGISGMHARGSAIGGHVAFTAGANGHTTVALWLPYAR